MVDGIAVAKAAKNLKEQLIIAYKDNTPLEINTKRKGAIKYLFKRYGVGGFEENKFSNGTDSFHGDLSMPEIPEKIFVSIIRERSNGFTTVSADALTKFKQPPAGATAEEKVAHIMSHLKNIS